MGGTRMEEMRGTGFAGSVSPFLGRERAAIDVDVERNVGFPVYYWFVLGERWLMI